VADRFEELDVHLARIFVVVDDEHDSLTVG